MSGAVDFNEGKQLNLDGLPPITKAVIEHVMNVRRIPIDFALAPVLTIAGAAGGNNFRLEVDSYTNTGCLWAMIVAPSGSNKSTPVKDLMQPLVSIDRSLYAQWCEDMKVWNAAEKSKKSEAQEDNPKPPLRQVVLDDATHEARCAALQCNPHGMLQYSDELAAMIQNLNRYSGQSGELSTLLTIFDGNKNDRIFVNRKTSAPIEVDNPFLSMLGGTQNERLESLFRSTEFLGSGFLPRFAIFMPQYLEPRKRSRVNLNPDIINNWDIIISTLYKYVPEEVKFSLSEEADNLYTSFVDDNEAQRMSASNDYMRSVLSKLNIIVLRICCATQALHYAEAVCTSNTPSLEVSGEVMSWACEVCKYLCETQARAYEFITGNPTKRLNKADLINAVLSEFPSATQRGLAGALGVSQQYVNKVASESKK